MEIDDQFLTELFSALGAHLETAGTLETLIVVGGANLIASGVVERTTKDVDVIARVEWEEGDRRLVRASPFPDALEKAIRRVARDFGLPPDWLNAVVDRQWETGLPPGLEEDFTWQEYSALTVGFVGRRGLIHLKFFAAADQGPGSVHWQDLLALKPTHEEIAAATEWVREQDIGPEFKSFVDEASERLRRAVDDG